MAYIGNQSATAFTSFDKQVITGNGGTTYTLSHAVANEQEIEVFVNNVRQEGGAGKAFTVSGNQITFTGAVASSDSCYVNFQGKAIQTVVPPDGSVGTAKISNNAVTDAKLANTLDLSAKSLTMPAGSIVQTQTLLYETNTAQATTLVSTNSTTSAQMGAGTPYGLVELAITPKFQNSKILITLNSSMSIINNASELIWELYRDSTPLLVSAGAFNGTANYFGWMYAYAGGGAQYRSLSASHVDTPNTTSTITYKPYHLRKSGAECTSLHWGSQMVMTLTEIKV